MHDCCNKGSQVVLNGIWSGGNVDADSDQIQLCPGKGTLHKGDLYSFTVVDGRTVTFTCIDGEQGDGFLSADRQAVVLMVTVILDIKNLVSANAIVLRMKCVVVARKNTRYKPVFRVWGLKSALEA
jgi:hypothetical protein